MTFSAAGSTLQELRFSVEWLPSSDEGVAERHCEADIEILLDNVALTRVDDSFSQTVRQAARLSAYRLAAWLAGNWWRLRWEPFAPGLDWEMRHCLSSIGGGYVWPDVTLASDGDLLRVISHSTMPAPFEPIAYLMDYEGVVTGQAFEKAVDDFLGKVISRMWGVGIQDDQLATVWAEVSAERIDEEASRYRRIEAATGFDPDEAPENLVSDLLRFSEEWGEGSAYEIAAALKHSASDRITPTMEWARQNSCPVYVPKASHLPDPRHSARPWERGYDLAEAFRAEVGLGIDPLTASAAQRLFDVPRSLFSSEQASELGIGIRDSHSSNVIQVSLGRPRPQGRRFELMCLIGGHLISQPADHMILATRAATSQQKLQRAFSAEILCPIQGIMEIVGNDVVDADTLDLIAERYDVPVKLVEWQIHNRAPDLRLTSDRGLVI